MMALVGTFYSFVMGMVFVPEIWWYILTLLTAGVFGLLCVKGMLNGRPERLLILGGVVIPLGIVLILSFWMKIYNEQSTRYLAFSQPFLILLFVMGWETIRSLQIKRTLLVLVILALCAALYPMYFKWNEVGMGNYREAADRLRSLVDPEDCIAVSGYAGVPLAYYLKDRLIKQMVFGSLRELPKDFPKTKRLWLVKYYDWPMLNYALDEGKGKLVLPQTPSGYDLVTHEVIQGRRPILISSYQRSPD